MKKVLWNLELQAVQRDKERPNNWVWTGLSMDKLITLQEALDCFIAEHPARALGGELYRAVTEALKGA